MKKSQPHLFDLMEEDLKKIAPNISFCKVYQTHLQGCGLIHNIHPACEYEEHTVRQHAIAVHLMPEPNSKRRLGNTEKVENTNIGDVAIVPSGVNHWQRIEKPSEGILLTVEPQQLSNFAYEIVRPDSIELLPTFAQPDPLIHGIALNLKQVLDSEYKDFLYVESLFNALIYHLLRNYSTSTIRVKQYSDGLSQQKLQTSIDYIQANLEAKIKLDDLAQLTNISSYYFCRLFKRSTGLTPYRYVLQQRIELGKRLLKQEDLPIAEISLTCGFANQSSFTTAFHKLVGVTPKAYQKEF